MSALARLQRHAQAAATRLLPQALAIRGERRLRGWLELGRLRRADLVVVSYGKSGRTWLRVMLSHYWQQRLGLSGVELLEFDNFRRLDRRAPAVLFTHDNYLGDWTGAGTSKADYRDRRVVMLVRDPADVAVSQYFQWRHRMRGHKKRLNGYPDDGADPGIAAFVLDHPAGLARVIAFMNAWAAALPTLRHATTVRYEDLRRDTAGQLGRVIGVLGEPADPVLLQAAVDYASLDNMRRREAEGASDSGRLAAGDRANPDSFKARRAKVGGYADYFTAAETARIDALVDAGLDPLWGYGRRTRAVANPTGPTEVT